MEEKERTCENLSESLRELVPSNGWDQVFAFGKKRLHWTAEQLRVSFIDYLKFVDGSPLTSDMKVSSKVGGKNGDSDEDTERRKVRPYNMKSMCSRLHIGDWDKFKAKYCDESTEEGRDMIDLCADIENFINGSLQEGATAGIYNAKMVMGLTDVAEHVKQEMSGFDGKSDEDIKAELERMQKLGLTDNK
jgi:hypothetical protein